MEDHPGIFRNGNRFWYRRVWTAAGWRVKSFGTADIDKAKRIYESEKALWPSRKFPTDACDMPSVLKEINNLILMPRPMPSAVYFLCDGDEVVYIGQSICPQQRIYSHSVKKFDRVYLLLVERKDLDHIEGAFIRRYRPRLNGKTHEGLRVRGPGNWNADKEYLGLIGVNDE